MYITFSYTYGVWALLNGVYRDKWSRFYFDSKDKVRGKEDLLQHPSQISNCLNDTKALFDFGLIFIFIFSLSTPLRLRDPSWFICTFSVRLQFSAWRDSSCSVRWPESFKYTLELCRSTLLYGCYYIINLKNWTSLFEKFLFWEIFPRSQAAIAKRQQLQLTSVNSNSHGTETFVRNSEC